ncbi:recombinase family protein [Pseudoalteromonas ruthenica]|uniref:recombinase family protein n=1 Tax=Pseudoalteromonas ruthenica TaxID=151081 RepID=UPI00148615AC|nr:recombinase family protein [Pseudoalteromonas ruthenica]
MAKNYAYIRISDNHKQDSYGQRDRISRYADEAGLFIYKWYEYSLSGSKTSKAERGLIEIIDTLRPGDRLLVNDIERIGRDSISDILEVITRIMNAGAEIHFCLSGEVITQEHKNDIGMFFITIGKAFGAIEFSRQRSAKAKAAANRRKRQGLPIGRAEGAIIRSKLDLFESKILFWLSQDVSKSNIARRLGVSPVSIIKWLDRRDELICCARDLKIYEPGMSIETIKERLKEEQKKKKK